MVQCKYNKHYKIYSQQQQINKWSGYIFKKIFSDTEKHSIWYSLAAADMMEKTKFLSGTTAHHLTNLLPHAEAPTSSAARDTQWTGQSYDQATTWRSRNDQSVENVRSSGHVTSDRPTRPRDRRAIDRGAQQAVNERRLQSYFRTCVWPDRLRLNRPSIWPYVPPIDRTSRVGKQALSATRRQASLEVRIITIIYINNSSDSSSKYYILSTIMQMLVGQLVDWIWLASISFDHEQIADSMLQSRSIKH